ncbi:Peptide methionine sulfoxide reductase MsrA [uncultured Comamonas sp.]|nr:Peptide methionine sulfoxide reductase MsrA [uncultured Comamonas sp.]
MPKGSDRAASTMTPTSAPSTLQASIYLAGGCFWCTEAIFSRVRGVLEVRSGYANGHLAHPSYEQVCSGTTGHAEVLQVVYDPQVLPLAGLLEIFFATHDPTTPDRQGNDVGPQYRSGIYTTTAEQLASARDYVAQLNQHHAFPAPVVTEVAPLTAFYPAEDAHQDYFARHPEAGYCAWVIAPKVAKFTARFGQHTR